MNESLIPIGAWIRMDIPQVPGFIGYTYLDREAGFSAQGGKPDGSENLFAELAIVRLAGTTIPWQILSADEQKQLALPDCPPWIPEAYGEQPPAGMLWGWWRTHPKLEGRFHPEAPDDLPVIVHDGGPRTTQHRPELVWVRVCGGAGDVFEGHVLNQPHNLQTVRRLDAIRFTAPKAEHLLMITEKYLAERADWKIRPCSQCGLDELFDAPSDLIRAVFPDMPDGSVPEAFTAFCGMCGGVQVVHMPDFDPGEDDADAPGQAQPAAKKWWQFWK